MQAALPDSNSIQEGRVSAVCSPKTQKVRSMEQCQALLNDFAKSYAYHDMTEGGWISAHVLLCALRLPVLARASAS
jgi:hypothetical protein